MEQGEGDRIISKGEYREINKNDIKRENNMKIY